MYARINTFDGSPERFEEGLAFVRERLIPASRMIPGFAGMISLVDRGSGRSMGITLWESQDALQASEEAVERVRSLTTATGEASLVSVETYEVGDLFLEPKHVRSA
jgi:hypothetical protein